MPPVDPSLYRELESLPETMIGEILHGELVASRLPPPRVGYATMALNAALGRPATGTGGFSTGSKSIWVQRCWRPILRDGAARTYRSCLTAP